MNILIPLIDDIIQENTESFFGHLSLVSVGKIVSFVPMQVEAIILDDDSKYVQF